MSEPAKSRRYRDPDVLAELYHEEDLTQAEIADKFGVSQQTIHHHMEKHGIETRGQEPYYPDAPHRDRELMRRLYVGEGLTTTEIADETGVTQPTVSKWLDRHGICRRDQTVNRAKFYTDQKGYEKWALWEDGKTVIIPVHRLLAVAEFGIGAIKGKDVHHGPAEIPWANWHDNIQLMDPSDHREHHGRRPHG